MKKLLSLSAACAVALMFASGAALAQDHDNDNHGHDRDHHSQKDHKHDDGRHDNRYDHGRDDRGRDDRDHDDRDHDYRGYRQVHYTNWHDRGRHEGWYHRGGYLPVEYRTRYVVTDWRGDRLREPPRGYQWVRSDNGDFLLVAITTGVIVDLLLNQ